LQGKLQKEIAKELSISERTLYTWIHQYAWNKLKMAVLQAPVSICNNIGNQLVELQQEIASSEPGKRFPTSHEAEITRKLVLSLSSFKKGETMANTMQVMEAFRSFVRPLNNRFAYELAHYANRFINEKNDLGYAPCRVEYGQRAI
jgi:transposase-like protein